MDLNSKKWMHILLLTSVALSKGASDVYGKIDVSNPAILGGQVTFAITLNRTCSNYTGKYNWQYTLQNIKQVFYPEDNVIIIENTTGKVNTTYTLTLMNATSTYHKTNISFYCDSGVLVDTVTLDLIDLKEPDDVTTPCTTPETTKLPAKTTDVALPDDLPPNSERFTFPLLYVAIGSVVSVVVVVVTIAAVYKCMVLRRQTHCKDRDAKDTPLRTIPEIVQPEADAGNDVQHMGVEGYQYANVQRKPQAAASGRQVENQQVEGAAMLVYADVDVESLERRSTHAHPRRHHVPTEYADIDFIRSAGMNRGSNLYANQERVHESAEYSNC